MMTTAVSASRRLLSVEDLTVRYGSAPPAVDGVSLRIAPGETVAIVGESGSGKTTTALAILGLVPPTAKIERGAIRWQANDDLLDPRCIQRLRGRSIGFVPQDPTVSLDPTQRVGRQVAEVLEVHGLLKAAAARGRAIELLEEAGISEPARRARQYPHELSGGMRQRVLIAIAWACQPELIIADEPTSALDVTIQRQVLDRLDRLRKEHATALLFVTHDLDVAADRADRIIVMKSGRIVETGRARDVLETPVDSYTRQLISAIPRKGRLLVTEAQVQPPRATERALVRATGLVKEYVSHQPNGSRSTFRAVNDVSLRVERGRTLAIVGESGSGKSTLARLVMHLERATSGTVEFDGTNLDELTSSQLRAKRRHFQLVQQNPFSSLSPQWDIQRIIAEPLRSFREGNAGRRKERVHELLEFVGLPQSFAERRPHQLSGGQRQRVAIARALALSPDLVVCDEPVSALDVSVQAQILALLAELQRELNLAYLFISHDLAVVREIGDTVIVMRQGKVVEEGNTDVIFDAPRHSYTRSLIDAIPGSRRDG